MTDDDRPGRPVKTTERSLAIVEAIRDADGATVTELSERLGLAKSTVLNHAHTLERNGYLVWEDDAYHVGLKFLHLGEYAQNRNDRYRYSKRCVLELANVTGEEVDFTVEEHGRLISLHHAVGNSNEIGFQVGGYFHMHNTAAGKAILAELDEERVESIVDRWGLPATTENTIVDRTDLFEELERIRERGFAVNDQELLEGYRSISVAVDDPNGGVFGALNVGGPTYRLGNGANDDNIVELLRSTVTELEEDIEKQTQFRQNWWEQYLHDFQ